MEVPSYKEVTQFRSNTVFCKTLYVHSGLLENKVCQALRHPFNCIVKKNSIQITVY